MPALLPAAGRRCGKDVFNIRFPVTEFILCLLLGGLGAQAQLCHRCGTPGAPSHRGFPQCKRGTVHTLRKGTCWGWELKLVLAHLPGSNRGLAVLCVPLLVSRVEGGVQELSRQPY